MMRAHYGSPIRIVCETDSFGFAEDDAHLRLNLDRSLRINHALTRHMREQQKLT